VRDHVLSGIQGGDLSVLVVWEPILGPDHERAARRSSVMLDDPRTTQFWIPTRDVGMLFRKPLGLESEPAWDVYLVYDRGVRWGAAPPKPGFFMHQMSGRLPNDLLLDGDRLASEIRRRLAVER
jgi:hypothetical protein